MTPREVLIAAKALISTPRKWGKYHMHNTRTGRRCALGAIDDARETAVLQLDTATHLLHRAIPSEQWTITSYNDDPETTHANVMAWFQRAIEAAP